jgi:hypothetical protein
LIEPINVDAATAPAVKSPYRPPRDFLMDTASSTAFGALAALWRDAGLPAAALSRIELAGSGPVVPSSFRIADAAQASLAAAALAAAEIRHARGHGRQDVRVDRTHAVAEACGWFSVDGVVPEAWDKISGLYPCGAEAGDAGWVRIHANFAHHRDGALRLLGCPEGAATQRADVERALRGWRAQDFEAAAAEAGLVVAAMRSFEEWDRHPQSAIVAARPLVHIERIGEAAPRELPPIGPAQQPLAGLRVLDLTRILAGPIGCRTLAAHGADVLLVNSPRLPNIDAIAETSRGKRSAHLELRNEAGHVALQRLLADAHVFVQGYRPGGLAALGFGPADLAQARPGIVAVSLSAYGASGPWGGRRGFDSLVQTATGFNHAEAAAAGAAKPQAMPLQILDYAAGFLLAFGAQAALLRQAREGGSWHVQVSLAGVAHWLRGMGRVADGFATARPSLAPFLVSEPSGFGRLVGVRHAAELAETPAQWRLPAMPPGTHAAAWSA